MYKNYKKQPKKPQFFFTFDAKCLILDNLTTEVEKSYREVYENCYGNESELEYDFESDIDVEMIDGQDERESESE